MTSNPALRPYSFVLNNADLVSGTLNRPGYVRVDKIYTLAQTLVVRTFGQVNMATVMRIRQLLQEITHPYD
jgi:mRNA interferase MazF